MNKRMESIYKDYQNNALGLDDTFTFKCRGCGKCCKNRFDIMLTARDLYNIAKDLIRTTSDIIHRYCEVYIGDSSRMPIVRLLPVGPDKACPLQREKRCIVHGAKPVVCALFPLGRAVGIETDNSSIADSDIMPRYFLQDVRCGTQDQTHTVRNWLKHFGLPVEDEFYVIWTQATLFISEFLRWLEENNAPAEVMERLWYIIYTALYLDFDTGNELIPQFEANFLKLKDSATQFRAEIENIAIGGLPTWNQTELKT